MALNAITPSDLENMAEEYEEQRMWEKMDAEAAENLSEEEHVEQMMAKVFEPESEEEELIATLFTRDGEYGFVDFAGVFDSLESILLYANEDDMELTVAEAGKDFDGGNDLDFFIVDVAEKVADVLYGVKLLPKNSFV